MRRGQHAADDGSFGKSAGGAMARGIALIVAAVLLGVVLLRATNGSDLDSAAGDRIDAVDEGGNADTGDDGDSVDLPATSTTLAPPRNPAEVTVLVANGAGLPGLAGRIAETLNGANYVTSEPTNTRAPADASVIYFTPGYEAEATAIAALLSPQPPVEALPDPAPVESVGTANVLVVAAADLAEPG